MTGSDSYSLSSAHFIQNRVIKVTQENSKHFCYAMLWGPFWFILVYFGPFWYTSWMTPPPLYDWFWLLSSFKCPFYPEKGHISDSKQILNTFALPSYNDYFDQFWSILVHFGAPHEWPHHPSMTGSDSYPLSSVYLTQKWIILVIEDKFKKLFPWVSICRW